MSGNKITSHPSIPHPAKDGNKIHFETFNFIHEIGEDAVKDK